jgi:hypothetical protein
MLAHSEEGDIRLLPVPDNSGLMHGNSDPAAICETGIKTREIGKPQGGNSLDRQGKGAFETSIDDELDLQVRLARHANDNANTRLQSTNPALNHWEIRSMAAPPSAMTAS